MKTKLLVKILLLLNLSTSVFAIPSKSSDNYSIDHLRVYTSAFGKKPYDIYSNAYSIFTFSQAVFGQPIYLSNSFEQTPGYIKSWDYNFKRNFYTLKVDTTRKFHGERNINASDVEFMLLKPFFTDLNLQERRWLFNIKGVADIKPGTPYKSGAVEGIRVVDKETLHVSLSTPNPVFLYSLSKSVPSLVPMEYMSKNLIDFSDKIVGAGEYKVAWDDPSSTLVRLEKVEKDKNVPTTIDIISEGDPVDVKADIVLGGISTYSSKNSEDYREEFGKIAIATRVIDFNFQNFAGSNPDFRKVLHHLIDRSKILTDKSTKELFEPLPDFFWGRLKAKNPHSLEIAKKLWEKLPTKIKDHQHIIYYHGSNELPAYLSEVSNQLKHFGIKHMFKQIKGIKLTEKEADASMFIYGTLADFVDPLNFFNSYLDGSNRPFQRPDTDPKFKQLFQNAMEAPSLDLRVSTIKELSKYFIEHNRAIPLYEIKMKYSVHKRVKTIGQQNLGPALDLSEVRLK